MEKSNHTTGNSSVSAFGAGLPPVPTKLVKRIQDGEFIDMSELAIDRLGLPLSDDNTKSVCSRRQPVTSIVEWAQCFSNYIALVAQTQLQRVSDLLGYQHLILEAHLQYEGDGWVAYNRHFRQIAATYPEVLRARRNMDLWNIAFAGHQCKPYCQHCFGSTHFSEECSGTPDTAGAPTREKGTGSSKLRTKRICRDWNFFPQPHCPYPGCRFTHICLSYCCSQESVG